MIDSTNLIEDNDFRCDNLTATELTMTAMNSTSVVTSSTPTDTLVAAFCMFYVLLVFEMARTHGQILMRIIFRSSDVQDCFANILGYWRGTLKLWTVRTFVNSVRHKATF